MNKFGKFAEKIGILVQGGTVNVGQIRLHSEMSRQELHNRKALLNNVRTAWVEGVLEKSLHEQIPIVLGLENRPSAVASPWNLELINPDNSCQPLPAGTPVIDVFDKLGEGGTLLILGEPGSGKTITLLQLARDLIARAEQEIDRRIPVVLNLSSWAAEKQTIAKWIVEELNSKYHVNRKIGQQWVEKQELLLLLDGLDEIRDLEKRKACVVALNAFQQEQATEMVVCCRIKDYEELGNQLKLRSALVIQPLTTNQIQTYLNQLESDVTKLKEKLTQDKTLQELAQSPLLLNIMVLAYNGINEDIPVIIIDSNPIKQLWNDYIERIFQGSRRFAHLTIYKSPEKQIYSRKDTTHWLVWMARRMLLYSQTIYLIEEIQFNWITLPFIEQLKIFGQSKLFRFIFIPIFLLVALHVLYGIFYSVLYGMSIHIDPPPLSHILDYEFLLLFSIAALIWLFEKIVPVGSVVLYIDWTTEKFQKRLRILKILTICLSAFIIVSNSSIFGQKSIFETLIILFIKLLIGSFWISFIWTMFLITEDSPTLGLRPLPVKEYTYPNQGIKTSAINFIVFGVILAILVAIFCILLSAQVRLDFRFIVGGWFILLLRFGLPYGGKALLQHFILRLVLCFTGSIPWKYAKFLDWASDKPFLQKVGGGYIFILHSAD